MQREEELGVAHSFQQQQPMSSLLSAVSFRSFASYDEDESVIYPQKDFEEDASDNAATTAMVCGVRMALTSGASPASIAQSKKSKKSVIQTADTPACGEVMEARGHSAASLKLAEKRARPSKTGGAARSLVRSMRSRSPFRGRSSYEYEPLPEVESSQETQTLNAPSQPWRSRSRSPLGRVVESITSKKNRRSSRRTGKNLDVPPRVGLSLKSSSLDDSTMATDDYSLSSSSHESSLQCSLSASTNEPFVRYQGSEDFEVNPTLSEDASVGSELTESFPANLLRRQPRESRGRSRTRIRAAKQARVPRSATPEGLKDRLSAEQMMAKIQLGSGASDAVQWLRDHETGLVSQSSKTVSVCGIAMQLYSASVDEAISSFRRQIGVSDEAYNSMKLDSFCSIPLF